MAAARPRRSGGLALSDLFGVAHHRDQAVTGITVDSRLVRPGDVYVALPGRTDHGSRFAADAVRAGAVAILTDAQGGAIAAASGCPVIVVPDPRIAMAPVAARIYGDPSTKLTMLAVTGTNGKTTTSYLLDAALRAAGRHVGVIGTIGFSLDGEPLPVARTTVTTPESPELQALLGLMAEGGADSCVMEVSSHAMVLHRADSIAFDVAAFTNFGRDHLDFHGDEESYFAAKASLFTPDHTRHAVVNVDDKHGRRLVDQIAAAGVVACSTTSLRGSGGSATEADYTATTVALRPDGTPLVRLECPDRRIEFQLALPGDFNIRNAVTALAMLDVLGVDLDAAAEGLSTAQVPGRMQRVDLGADAPTVFVDFAHTPQAVTAALGAVGGSRRVVVLGCGGDRDPDKRAPMGAAAAANADLVIVTDDNPRIEDPAAIRRQILDGVRAEISKDQLSTVVIDGGDRRSAIRTALQRSGPGDVIAVLGKGHESGQEIGGAIHPFNDIEVVAQEWAALRASQDTGARR